MKNAKILVLTGILAGGFSALAGTDVVTPSNMDGWTFQAVDDNGAAASTAPYTDAVGQMVTGPATPPLGTGSAELATAANGGDGASKLITAAYDGTKLSSITSLSYSTYDKVNNGQQFPYMEIAVSLDGSGTPASEDSIFFEPPYQTPGAGNSALPNQGAPVLNQWQTWNAFSGAWWDNDASLYDPTLYTPATAVAGGGAGLVNSLAAFEALYPDATIMDNPYPGNGDGGISFQVGYAGSTDNFDGFVDDVTIGTDAGTTTYDFEPSGGAVPDNSSTLGLLAISGAAFAGFRRFAQKTVKIS